MPVPGVPANPYPAKVINLSVGGQGPCASQIQAIVDQILDAGVFIAVAAGNDNAERRRLRSGELRRRVHRRCDGLVLARAPATAISAQTWTSRRRAATVTAMARTTRSSPPGTPAPRSRRDPIYADADGTSFSTPEVAGVAALMLAVNPALRPAQIKALMAQSASPFAAGSDCVSAGICGAGILNAFGAVKAAQAALGGPVAAPVVEYYNQSLDHYFMTAAGERHRRPRQRQRSPAGSAPATSFNAYRSATRRFRSGMPLLHPARVAGIRISSRRRLPSAAIAAGDLSVFPCSNQRTSFTLRCPTAVRGLARPARFRFTVYGTSASTPTTGT